MAAADLLFNTQMPLVGSSSASQHHHLSWDVEPDSSMDTFFDFNQAQATNVPSSSSSSRGPKQTTYRPQQASPAPSASTVTIPDEQGEFAAPSHDYGRYPQQIGVPTGSVAHFDYLRQHQGGSDEIGGAHAVDSWQQAAFDDVDMVDDSNALVFDGSFEAPLALQQQQQHHHQQHHPQRIYPGMHTAQQQNLMTRQQQQHRPSLPSQQTATVPFPLMSNSNIPFPMQSPQSMPPLQVNSAQVMTPMGPPSAAPTVPSQRSRRSTQTAPQQATPASSTTSTRRRGSSAYDDEFTQQTIKSVLQKIREDSQGALQDEDEDGLPHLIRMKKDEEDMDDDERLLASEEGKKLSSKERRQLRNKVSARAFRSRRKDYIQSLEAAIKDSNEELKVKQAENTQLVNLVNMLLAQPGMRNTLETLSRDESFLQQATHTTQQPPANVNALSLLVPSSTAGQSSRSPLSATATPATHASELDVTNSALSAEAPWTGATDSTFDFIQPNVFAVFEVPQGPSLPELNIAALSGKCAPVDEDDAVLEESKADIPMINRLSERKEETKFPAAAPVADAVAPVEDAEMAGNPLFALYANAPAPVNTSASQQSPSSPALSKVYSIVVPTVSTSTTRNVDADLSNQIKRMNATLARIERML